jgi:hypothetical protein
MGVLILTPRDAKCFCHQSTVARLVAVLGCDIVDTVAAAFDDDNNISPAPELDKTIFGDDELLPVKDAVHRFHWC